MDGHTCRLFGHILMPPHSNACPADCLIGWNVITFDGRISPRIWHAWREHEKRAMLMATLAFDSLRYARRLKDAGVPEPQAEVQAELMAEAFGFYADNIVTRDYLDATLRAAMTELEARLEARLNQQDVKLAAIEATMQGNFRVLSALMGVTLLAVAVPAIESVL